MRKKLIIGGIILGMIIVLAVAAAHMLGNNNSYFFIDWDNNKGVAKKCYVEEGSLICEKINGGFINVKQFWK